LPAREAEPAPGLPDPPPHLSELAREQWHKLGGKLAALRLVTEIDAPALAALCQAYARWAEAEEKIRQFGPVITSPSGYLIQSPYLAIANRSLEQMMRILVEFGMTPSSRSRVAAEDYAPASPFEELRNRGSRSPA
jgi:P27 family predicted phage terminase small subunit